MKYSHKLSDSIHILAYVKIYQRSDLSSTAIAASIESNPSFVRRLMAKLTKAELLKSRPRSATPVLGREAEKISLLDIYQAVEESKNLLHVDHETNPKCIVGGNIQGTLSDIYNEIQSETEAKMASINLEQIIKDILFRQKNKN